MLQAQYKVYVRMDYDSNIRELWFINKQEDTGYKAVSSQHSLMQQLNNKKNFLFYISYWWSMFFAK